MNKLATILILVSIPLFAQVAEDTTLADTTEAEESGREMYTSVDVSYSQDKGNTDYQSLYYGFSFTLIGDMGPFNDTEFLFDFNRSDDQFDGSPFADDQSLILKFDIWANQRLSPFLFFQKSFDNIIGLQDRLNYGLGAKVSGPLGLSLSYALLFEKEDYLQYTYTDSIAPTGSIYDEDYYGTDSIAVDYNDYWDVEYDDIYWLFTDSSAYYYDYTDSTEAPAEEFFRHSIRPKIKLKLFNENLAIDYRFYYKPKIDDFNDYLLEHELKVSIATFYELLTVDMNYTNKYNARYDKTKIFNPETGEPYEAVDESIIIGLSFMF